ncbi:MAG: OmpH family outer membrane protein [Myxococcaceae bacterium]|nr:OmpH family outer membrane protein [Myxococcaceae bacterium]MCI0671788.1 OmpH family outer membrane protein [Myxococcaceae bacterium]
MSLRRSLAALAAVSVLSTSAVALAADFKMGVVDVEAVMAQTEDGKAARARMQKWLETQQKTMEKEQQAFLKEKETLEKQASAMSPETLTQKQGELQKKYVDLAQKAQKLQGEAQAKEMEEIKPILTRIDQVVQQVAKKDGLSVVLEKRNSGIAYLAQGLDYTEEVIRQYNALPKMSAPAAKKDEKKK